MINKVINLPIKGAKIFVNKVHEDIRGDFTETFVRNNEFNELNLDYIQENESISNKYTFRGLHFQKGSFSQNKLIRLISGSVFDILFDLRKSSETFKKIYTIELNKRNELLFVPSGVAHGFLSLKNNSIVNYKCDNYYNPKSEGGVNPLISKLRINWPLDPNKFIISKKDKLLSHINECYFFD